VVPTEVQITEVQQEAARLVQNGSSNEAAKILTEALKQCQTSALWNDLATAVYVGGNLAVAEQAYRCALLLDASNCQAAVNLSLLLLKQGRFADSLPIITRHIASLTSEEKAAIKHLISR
jgi:Flp pilus assembly protein TadD